jgi:hypothetical protein
MKWRRKRWVGHVACMGEERNMCKLLVGKPEGKGPLGRPICRWVDSIKMNLIEKGRGGVDWIGLAQDRYSSCEHGDEPSGPIKCWKTVERLHNL